MTVTEISGFFPVAKSLNKWMLPVLEQPVLAYAVADCLAAGVCEIAIVTAAGESGRQVRHYFTEDHGMRDYFAARGWQEKYESIAHIHDQADFTFIEQPRDVDRYGTALPVILAADFIADQDFFLIAGDDLLLRPDGGSDLADLAAASTAAGTWGAVAAATVPGTDAQRYGILSPRNTPAATRSWTACWRSRPTAPRPRSSTSAAACSQPTQSRTSRNSPPPPTANTRPPTPLRHSRATVTYSSTLSPESTSIAATQPDGWPPTSLQPALEASPCREKSRDQEDRARRHFGAPAGTRRAGLRRGRDAVVGRL
ncbi:sugar phosphate nucleotidyltransferase [Streptomyces sp. NPDC058690]|uniref:sugar phosphate nucleotidyltransferase n=1 Tax=Streptomyces sp. NPDC058690 TaxID=3346600 RepID=UPI0036505B0E